jgi:hypothetical protein
VRSYPETGLREQETAPANFVLIYLFTCGDQRPRTGRPVAVWGRWTAYQGSVAGTALLNMGVFVVAR